MVAPGEVPKGVPSPRMTTIQDCKTGTEYDINSGAREYTEIVPGKPKQIEEQRKRLETEMARVGGGQQGPTSTVEVETKDTGERQTFFGYTARHVVTTRRYFLSQGTHSVDEVSDGWYIDLPVSSECKAPPCLCCVGSGSRNAG